MKNKKSKKKSLIRTILKIEIFLILCIVITVAFRIINQARKDQQMLAQLQIEQEEITRQGQLKYQAEQKELKEQEELARQEQEKYEEIKNSLPTKFNMRDKIKITAENQRQKPFCSVYAHFKSMEIALNYQGNYNYDFKKVYNYLKTASNELPYEIGDGILYDLSEELLGIDFTYEHYSRESEDFMTTLKNEIVNGRPILIDINDKLSDELSKSPKRKCKWKWKWNSLDKI